MPGSLKYPSISEVVAADREQVSFWWRFLPEPKTTQEERVLDLVFVKYYLRGGRTIPDQSDERHG